MQLPFWHVPPVQRRPLPWQTQLTPSHQRPGGQAFPHVPQLLLLLLRLMQWPWPSGPGQQAWVVHTLPQAPQLAGSRVVSTQVLPHSVWPGGQVDTQAPSEHLVPAGQARPHAPQLAGSESTLAQVLPDPMPAVPPGQQCSALSQQPPMQVRLSGSHSQHTGASLGHTGTAARAAGSASVASAP